MTTATPSSDRSFGQALRARWAVRGLSRGSGSVRRVARTSQSFASVVGRSLTARSVIRQPLATRALSPRRAAPTASAAGSVTPPAPSLMSVLMRVSSGLDEAGDRAASVATWPPPSLARTLPSLARRSPSLVGETAATPPSARPGSATSPGLPRVTRRASRTSAGPFTGPAGGSTRLTPQQVAVRQPPEVAAVGRTLTPRDQGRAPRGAARTRQPNTPGRSHPGPPGSTASHRLLTSTAAPRRTVARRAAATATALARPTGSTPGALEHGSAGSTVRAMSTQSGAHAMDVAPQEVGVGLAKAILPGAGALGRRRLPMSSAGAALSASGLERRADAARPAGVNRSWMSRVAPGPAGVAAVLDRRGGGSLAELGPYETEGAGSRASRAPGRQPAPARRSRSDVQRRAAGPDAPAGPTRGDTAQPGGYPMARAVPVRVTRERDAVRVIGTGVATGAVGGGGATRAAGPGGATRAAGASRVTRRPLSGIAAARGRSWDAAHRGATSGRDWLALGAAMGTGAVSRHTPDFGPQLLRRTVAPSAAMPSVLAVPLLTLAPTGVMRSGTGPATTAGSRLERSGPSGYDRAWTAGGRPGDRSPAGVSPVPLQPGRLLRGPAGRLEPSTQAVRHPGPGGPRRVSASTPALEATRLLRVFAAPGSTVRPPDLITVAGRDAAGTSLPVGRDSAGTRVGASGSLPVLRRPAGASLPGRSEVRVYTPDASAVPARQRVVPGPSRHGRGGPPSRPEFPSAGGGSDGRRPGAPAGRSSLARSSSAGRRSSLARRVADGSEPTRAPGRSRSQGGVPSGSPPRRPTATHPGTTALGRRFLEALSLRPPDRDQPLPVQLRPLAHLVVGPQRAATVRVRTGRATSEALAEVGRPAATVGNVVHLAAPPSHSARSAEVVAHELVHAGRPSPVPRFFQDDHDSAEERQAALTGGLVRDLARKSLEGGGLASALQRRVDAPRLHRSAGLTFGTSGLSVAPGASPLTAGTLTELAVNGRAQAGTATGGGQGGAGVAAARRASGAVAASSGSAASGSDATDPARVLHRRRAGGRHRIEPPEPTLPPTVARLLDRSPNPPVPGFGTDHGSPGATSFDGADAPFGRPSTRFGGPMSPPFNSPSRVEPSTHPISQETLDWIVEAVEERILAELERRGLRYQPGVF